MLPVISTDPMALQLLAMQQEAPLLVALFDAADQLQYANAAFRQAYGLNETESVTWPELMLRSFAHGTGSLIKTHDITGWLASARSRRGKLPFRAFEADLCDGRWIWMTETVRTDGWMLCVASDITELKSSGRSVRQERDVALRAAQTDALTGISNRAHIMQLLEQSLQALQQQFVPCGIALVDLDHFKSINDTYGHQAGDTVLLHFARTIHGALRREDGFGRVGGEEFLILFPGMAKGDLSNTMPRLLDLIRQSEPLPEFPDFRLTCSAGLSMLHTDDDARSVYRRIDEALYSAKAAGRDRSEWAV